MLELPWAAAREWGGREGGEKVEEWREEGKKGKKWREEKEEREGRRNQERCDAICPVELEMIINASRLLRIFWLERIFRFLFKGNQLPSVNR